MRDAGGQGIRNFLTVLFALLLLDWNLVPVEPLWARLGYTVVLTLLVWFALLRTWRHWKPDAKAEDRTRRTIAGGIAGAAIVSAVLTLKATEHYECTQEVRTRDGTECVGDYVIVPGPDRGGAFIYGLIAVFAVWFGVHADED